MPNLIGDQNQKVRLLSRRQKLANWSARLFIFFALVSSAGYFLDLSYLQVSKAAAAPSVAVLVAADVTISNFAYTPQSLSVETGKTVIWQNNGTVHTVTALNGSYDSGNILNGQTYSHQYTAAGTYDYICTLHGSMTGKIIVKDPPVIKRAEIEVATLDIVLTGSWNSFLNANASNGELMHSRVKNDKVTVSFVGSRIDLLVTKAKLAGKAKVCLDALNCRTLDLYSNTPKWRSVATSYTGLTNSAHTLTIQVLGTKNASSSNTYVPIDAVDVYQ